MHIFLYTLFEMNQSYLTIASARSNAPHTFITDSYDQAQKHDYGHQNKPNRPESTCTFL